MNPGIPVLFLGFQCGSWIFSIDSGISVRSLDSSEDTGILMWILRFQCGIRIPV